MPKLKELEKTENEIEDKKEKMTKEEKKELKRQKKKEKKGSKKWLAIKVIIFFILAGGISFFVFRANFLGIGDKVRPTLGKIPYVNRFIEIDNERAEKSRGELLIENDALLKTIDNLESDIEKLYESNENYLLELDKLRELENNYLTYVEDKKKFDMEVGNLEPTEYLKYYKGIEEETAKEIYENLIGKKINQEEMEKYISRYENMDPKVSAGILEELLYTDRELVINIVNKLSIKTSSEVLEAMKIENSATILKRLTPTN